MIVRTAREHGVPLVTTENFVDEVYRHGSWASHLVETHGAQSLEVLQAARGEGFKQNAFIDGFVLYSVDQHQLRFPSYLSVCVGGQEFTRANISDYLEKHFGIELIDSQEIASKRSDAFVDRDDTEEFIREQAEDSQVDKSDTRISAEAEAYVIVANWEVLRPGEEDSAAAVSWDIGLLSQGGFLNRIAHLGPRPINKKRRR
ncbi:MAG: hypothetical protein HYY02_07710 [Chloroflexi bacterium]|nr:hypothetical protein [Chloroflexota bacterium]